MGLSGTIWLERSRKYSGRRLGGSKNLNGSLYIRGHPLLNHVGVSQALHQPHPLLFSLFGLCGSMEVFCFSFSPISILASTAARGLSASRSAPSPSWPLRQPEGFLLLVQPHLHICLCGSPRAFCLGCTVGLECIVKLGLVSSITYVTPNTFYVQLIKL